MVSVQRIPERSIRSLTRFLHAPSTRPHGDGQAFGQIFVIVHAKAIAVEIVRDAAQRLTLGPEQPAFSDALAYPFMQRALTAGILVGVMTSLLGVLVVLRRSAFFGDAIAHAALAGVDTSGGVSGAVFAAAS